MTHNNINPFHELYFTESIDSDEFVKLFSDVLVQPALPLFKPGNVILKGLPGSGKTMMLNLLKPSIRVAYHHAGKSFPVPAKFNKFIGAGINLIRSSVSDFGQRPINEGEDDKLHELSVYFGDFLNYWICRDILDSLNELKDPLGKEIGINFDPEKVENFIVSLKKEECWFGQLDEVRNLEDLKDALKLRTNIYRSYLNYNLDSIPEKIKQSKTSIGIPIITLVQKLRDSGVIAKGVQVYVRIDQFEELAWLDHSISNLGSTFQSVVHKLLAMRDSTVSYRIGTRPFDWQQGSQQIFGTSAKLEALRNYKEISIEEVLRRSETQRGYIFPSFAQDIFSKRLDFVYQLSDKSKTDLLKFVFGDGLTAREKAKLIVKTGREKIVNVYNGWPLEWVKFIQALAVEDPFSAKLAEAWALQKGKSNVVYDIPQSKPFPWEAKKYWVKERSEQAIMQIASRARQSLVWSGKDDLLNLSGGNILAFLSLCQHIWEVWMRDNKKNFGNVLPQIEHQIQTLGILEASRRWFESLSATSTGKEIKLFIIYTGGLFYKTLTDDVTMSYPGGNGFSVILEDLESTPQIFKFLKDAADGGNLVVKSHTPKTKGKMRVKWYLNSILSPYFKIPAIHTKEPMYITIDTLNEWLTKSKAFPSSSLFSNRKSRVSKSGQMDIFDKHDN